MAATAETKVFDENVADDAVLEKFGYEPGQSLASVHTPGRTVADASQSSRERSVCLA